jgi:hypothetical protein
MKLETIADVIRELRDCMPESLRTLVAHRILVGFLNTLPHTARSSEQDNTLRNTFFARAALTTDLPFVDHDIQLSDSDLAKFCNRWMAVEKYRDPEDGDWHYISPQMNQIRYTICKELEALAQGQESLHRGLEQAREGKFVDPPEIEPPETD